MRFEDVEKARKALIERERGIRKKAFLIVLCILIVITIVVAICGFGVNSFVSSSNLNFSLIRLIGEIFIPIIVFVFFSSLIIMIVLSIKTKKEREVYVKAYKAYFINKQLVGVFTNLQYDHEKGLDESVLKSTDMIYTGDAYSSNDLVKGKYGKVGFMQADVTITDRHEDSDGNTYYVTVFRGRYMIFEFPKKFNFRLAVIPSGYYHNFSGGHNFKKVELESIDFNKKFNVYAEDNFGAFYILDPSFMVKMEELSEKYNNRLALYFADNKLIIGINNGNDSFEPPNPKLPIDEKAEIEKVSNDIKVITDFVDELHLDR